MKASEQQRDDIRLERWLFERLRPALAAKRLEPFIPAKLFYSGSAGIVFVKHVKTWGN